MACSKENVLCFTYIHYIAVSLLSSIGVVSGREGIFRVTCTATGGTLSTSSLTGPVLGGGGLQLQAEGSIGRTGKNTYSVTSDTIRTEQWRYLHMYSNVFTRDQ